MQKGRKSVESLSTDRRTPASEDQTLSLLEDYAPQDIPNWPLIGLFVYTYSILIHTQNYRWNKHKTIGRRNRMLRHSPTCASIHCSEQNRLNRLFRHFNFRFFKRLFVFLEAARYRKWCRRSSRNKRMYGKPPDKVVQIGSNGDWIFAKNANRLAWTADKRKTQSRKTPPWEQSV